MKRLTITLQIPHYKSYKSVYVYMALHGSTYGKTVFKIVSIYSQPIYTYVKATLYIPRKHLLKMRTLRIENP